MSLLPIETQSFELKSALLFKNQVLKRESGKSTE